MDEACKRVLALIPARGGSKGLPGKNTRELGGKPLIAWTIEAAQRARHVHRVVVSSDDEATIAIARAWGAEVPFVRPAALAQDDTPSMDVVLHALQHIAGAEWLVLLQPTSPLRTADDVDVALSRCWQAGAPACVSVTPAATPPHWMFQLSDAGRLQALLPENQRPQRRQDAPACYVPNGAIYVARIDWLRRMRTFFSSETVAYLMPPERSVDIDTALDWQIAACLLAQAQRA